MSPRFESKPARVLGHESAPEAAVLVAALDSGQDRRPIVDAVSAAGGRTLDTEPTVVGVFDDVAAAVDSALEIRLRAPRGHDGSSLVRVAVDGAGEAGDGAGPARTLVGAANPGEVLIGRSIQSRLDAGRELLFEGTVRAGDGREPLAAWRRAWPPVTGSLDQPPLPEGVRSAWRTWGLFGRRPELGRIEEAWRIAVEGRRGLALVAGEPGIGKTRLVTQAAGDAHASGAAVLYGHHDAEPGVAHQGLAEALEHLATHAPPELLEGLRDESALLADLVPALSRTLDHPPAPVADPGARHLLFVAVASLLSSAARRRPLILILEDLHVADLSSLLLLRHLLLGPTQMAALVIGTYRPGEMAEECAAELADLATRVSATEVELGGLGADEMIGLARQITPAVADNRGALGPALRRDTGGNPLFATEVLRDLSESGSDAGAADRANGGGELPTPRSVRAAIAARIRRLGPGAGEILALAAAAGRECNPTVLALAFEVPPVEVERALDAATRAGLLEPTSAGGYRFGHAVIMRSIYEAQSVAARGRAHRALADALERVRERGWTVHAAELARHWLEARPPDPARAMVWAERAGEAALERYQPDGAARSFAKALELEALRSNSPAHRCDLLVGLGTAQRHKGDASFRETLLEAGRLAAEIDDPERLVRAALANTRGMASFTGRVDPDRVSLLERAVDTLGDQDSLERAQLLASLAQELTFSGDSRRIELSDEAVATARRLGDEGALATALVARFMPTWAPATLEQRLDDTAQGVAIADGLGDPMIQFHALHWRSVGLIQAARIEEATETVEREEALARRLGDATAPWIASFDRGNLAVVAGRLGDAERLAERSLQMGMESGQPDALAFYASQIACIRWEQGRLSDLLPVIEQAVEANPGIPAFRSLLALALAEAGRTAGGGRLVADEAGARLERLPADPAWLAGAVTYGHACAAVGDADSAEILSALLAPYADQIVYTGISVWGDVEWALGRLAATRGEYEEAERRLASAVLRAERAGATLWRARAEVSLAEALVAGASPDAERARTLFARAAEAATRGGAAALERRARMALAELSEPDGAQLDPAAERLRGRGLTERQIDVMELVARGRTNADIAAALGIQPGTVKRHLEGVYDKLGVRGRAAAVASLLSDESGDES